MNIDVAPRPGTAGASRTAMAIADCDIHPVLPRLTDLYPYLTEHWRHYLETYGLSQRQGHQSGVNPYPKAQPNAARRDAWPPGGGAPGTDLDFLRRQHLDVHNIVLGIVNPLTPSGQGLANPGLSGAMCHATNEWQCHALVANEPRLRASIVVPYEDPEASAAEIGRYAGNPAFAQVLLLGRTGELLGQRRYRPIFRAAVHAGLPVALHAFGYSGQPVTGSGWPSFYIEEMTGHAQCAQAQLSSMVLEGLFAELPALKVIVVEAGFAWLPALAWRLDQVWSRLRSETPDLLEPPSATLRRQVWLTTQPMEEPEPREHLLDTIGWIGWDRLLFATDYPHWDFDDPAHALPLRIGTAERHDFFIGNAMKLYGIG
jgi:predicted TIM-barrel fold metal-dependent hydrolase